MKLKLYVSLPKNELTLARAALDAGADGVKVHLNAFHRASGTTFGGFEQEKPFLEALSKLGGEKFVMAGQETVPSLEEMQALKRLGFSGFNLYLKHAKPHLLESGIRPILALEHGFTEADIDAICAVRDSAIEASIADFTEYGKPLSESDLAAFGKIVQRSKRTVIVPSQKKIAPSDLPALKGSGVSAVLLGVIVLGQTPESIAAGVREFRSAIDEDRTPSAG